MVDDAIVLDIVDDNLQVTFRGEAFLLATGPLHGGKRFGDGGA